MAERLSETVDESEVRIRSLRGDTFEDIAKVLLPDEYETCSRIAQMAVSHVARRIFSTLGMKIIRARNKRIAASRGGLAFRPRKGECAELEESDKQNVSWSEEEVNDLIHLVEDGNYVYEGGMHDGKPCYPLIAEDLNVTYHNSIAIRTANACCRKYKREVARRRSQQGESDSMVVLLPNETDDQKAGYGFSTTVLQSSGAAAS